MVDTLVLGTSAKAWEFESLHAQIKGTTNVVPFFMLFIWANRLSRTILFVKQNSVSSTPRVSCLVRLMKFAYNAGESLHAQIKGTTDVVPFFILLFCCIIFLCRKMKF